MTTPSDRPAPAPEASRPQRDVLALRIPRDDDHAAVPSGLGRLWAVGVVVVLASAAALEHDRIVQGIWPAPEVEVAKVVREGAVATVDMPGVAAATGSAGAADGATAAGAQASGFASLSAPAIGGLSASGYVIAVTQADVTFKTSGRIEQLLVEEGQSVKKDQLLARLDDGMIRAQLQQSQAALSTARSRLAELTAGSRTQDIGKSRAAVAEARARLADAQANQARNKALFDGGAIPRRDLDDGAMKLDVARAQVDSTQQALSMALEGPRAQEVDSARSRVQEAEAALAQAQVLLDDTRLTAPFDGTIIAKHMSVGETVSSLAVSGGAVSPSSTPVYTLADLAHMEAEVDVSETNIAQIVEGRRATVTLDAYADVRFDGRVRKVMPRANRQKAIVPVRVTILAAQGRARPDLALRPDMQCKVAFAEAPVEPGAAPRVLVPRRAVASVGGRSVVWCVVDSRVHAAFPALAPTGAQDLVPVTTGLSGGETVVLDPPDALAEGMQIRIKGAAAATSALAPGSNDSRVSARPQRGARV